MFGKVPMSPRLMTCFLMTNPVVAVAITGLFFFHFYFDKEQNLFHLSHVMKITLLAIVSLCLVSCTGVQGYKPEEMSKAFSKMSEVNESTRLYRAFGYFPNL